MTFGLECHVKSVSKVQGHLVILLLFSTSKNDNKLKTME